jgi:putative hydroxymethylpyrimidine transport system substrate-binding protein
VRRARRVVPALLVLAAVALTAAGCGEKSEPTNQTPAKRSIDLVLDWFPNPDHVALYEATAKGYFSQVGLDVKPHVPSDPASPIKQVAAGRAQVAISYEPEVLLARQQGLPVVAIGALVQRPLTSLIATRKSGVRSVRDLRGKRVVTAGIPYQSAYLKTILRRAQVPESSVKETNVGSSLLPAMLSGKVDATLGGFWNVEGVELSDRGAKPWITPVDRLGVPPYNELVLVANSDKLGDQRDDLRLFVSALARGAKAARQDPDAVSEERPPVGLPGSGGLAELRRLDGQQRRPEDPARHQERDHERSPPGTRAEVDAGTDAFLASEAGARRRGTTSWRRRSGGGPCRDGRRAGRAAGGTGYARGSRTRRPRSGPRPQP